VSLDATPEQYDQLGEFYAHKQGPRLVERVKHGLNRRCFERAAHLITWSEWARQGLMRDYGIAPEQVTAIAPGVDLGRWQRPENRQGGDDGVVRILFVGSDLQRKGGDQLLAAIRALRRVVREPRVELHLVTTATVEAEPGVVVHSGVSPNSPELIRLYQTADIFCLPTLGDCLPMVLAEAAASGLPLISTDVGAIHEIVRTGVTGQLVPAGNVEALVEALRTLVVDSALRMRLGGAARRLAEQDHDASANTEMVIDILLKQIDSRVTVSTE
jgi:glycosyltransferase involved in cell wall biosynthesis